MRKRKNDLLIELPEYKRPSAHTVYVYVWEKIKDYLSRAGTVIFAASILMWFILNFGPAGYGDMADSFGAIIGKASCLSLRPSAWGTGRSVWPSSPVFRPRKSSYPVSPSSSMASTSILRQPGGFGSMMSQGGFTQLNAYCMMLFSLLYIPCAATIATIHAESHSWKWTAFSVCFQIAVAWVLTFVVYQIGSRIF
mgnify:CR=1 FL=1